MRTFIGFCVPLPFVVASGLDWAVPTLPNLACLVLCGAAILGGVVTAAGEVTGA